MDGILDVVTLGNLLELCWVYDLQTQGDDAPGISVAEVAQRKLTWASYTNFRKKFSALYRLLFDGDGETLVDPTEGLFDPSILHLAVSIVKYKEMEPTSNSDVTVEDLKHNLLLHFSKNYRHLVQELKSEWIKSMDDLEYCRVFDWQGPTFAVVPIESAPKHPVSPGEQAFCFVLVCFVFEDNKLCLLLQVINRQAEREGVFSTLYVFLDVFKHDFVLVSLILSTNIGEQSPI